MLKAAHISRENNTHEIVFSNLNEAFEGMKHVPRFMPTYYDRPSQGIAKK